MSTSKLSEDSSKQVASLLDKLLGTRQAVLTPDEKSAKHAEIEREILDPAWKANGSKKSMRKIIPRMRSKDAKDHQN